MPPHQHLREVISSLAVTAGSRITLDLFASRSSAFCPHYFSEAPEPDSEGQDALGQPNWAASVCPMCQRLRLEFVLLHHPFHLITRAVKKAQFDQ